MKKHISSAWYKLYSTAGDSITEVLVALLISAVAMVMLASMISISTRMIRENEEKMDTYYAANEDLTHQIEGSGTNANGTITFYDDGGTATATIKDVHYRVNGSLGAKDVVAYWKS